MDHVQYFQFTKGYLNNWNEIFFSSFLNDFLYLYSTPLLHRCVPTGRNAPGETVRDAYDLLNSWSVAQQFLSDLYITWPIVLMMCLIAFGLLNLIHQILIIKILLISFVLFHTVLSIFLIALMGILTNIISWFICVFAIVASIAITTVLWLTYYDIRNKQDSTIKYSYLEEFVRNETAIYALAIIATVIMVIILLSL